MRVPVARGRSERDFDVAEERSRTPAITVVFGRCIRASTRPRPSPVTMFRSKEIL